jgi:hypothetical protein
VALTRTRAQLRGQRKARNTNTEKHVAKFGHRPVQYKSSPHCSTCRRDRDFAQRRAAGKKFRGSGVASDARHEEQYGHAPDYRDGERRHSHCRICNRTAAAKKAKLPETKRRFWKALLKKRGLTEEQYDQMLAAQGGGCAICGARSSDHNKRLGVDHNHQTGEVRGILCDNCNQGLGAFKESIQLLRRAMPYLLTNAIILASAESGEVSWPTRNVGPRD